jgi:hypothetical protein
MGYRSEVVLAVTKEVLPALHCLFAKKPEVQKLCTVDSELDTNYEDGWLMRWDGIKWYDSDDVISDLIKFIDALDAGDLSDYGLGDDEKWCDHFNFVRIGEDYEDVESKGWGFDSIGMTREISY